jgi:hypothetical protein
MISTCLDLALLCHPLLALLTIQRSKMQTHQHSWWQFVLLSFLSLLAVRYVSSSSTVSNSTLDGVAPSVVCQSDDQPNPIASTYPNNATGVLNGTISVVPISLDLARQLIPSQYRILEHAYRHLLPSFPKDKYPIIVQAVHDHDIRYSGFSIPGFSVSSRCSEFIIVITIPLTKKKTARWHRISLSRLAGRQQHLLQMGALTPHFKQQHSRN